MAYRIGLLNADGHMQEHKRWANIGLNLDAIRGITKESGEAEWERDFVARIAKEPNEVVTDIMIAPALKRQAKKYQDEFLCGFL